MMIQYQGKTIKKPVGKMKWDRMSGLPNDVLKRLKALGWKPGLF